MTTLYFVRHCEALGNVQRLFQGTTDLDITELGSRQLEALEKRFSSISLDKVISSPLIRTRKTAKAIIGTKDLNFTIDDGFVEICGGYLEGKKFSETFGNDPELFDIWTNHPEDFAPEGGEPMRDAYERIWEATKKTVSENKGKTIAFASHGGIIRCLLCRLLYNDITKLASVPFSDNTAVTLIEFDDDLNYEVKYYNDISHITEDLKNPRATIKKL